MSLIRGLGARVVARVARWFARAKSHPTQSTAAMRDLARLQARARFWHEVREGRREADARILAARTAAGERESR